MRASQTFWKIRAQENVFGHSGWDHPWRCPCSLLLQPAVQYWHKPRILLSKGLIPWTLQGSFCSPHQTLAYTRLCTSLTQENPFPRIKGRTSLPSELGESPGHVRAPNLNVQLPTPGFFFTVMSQSYFWPILGILNNCLKIFYTSECDFASLQAPCPQSLCKSVGKYDSINRNLLNSHHALACFFFIWLLMFL